MAINRSQTNAFSASNGTLSSLDTGTASNEASESKNADPLAFARQLLYRRSSDPDESTQLRTALSAAEESFAETAAYYGRPVSFYGFSGAGPSSPYPRSAGVAGPSSPFVKSPRQHDQRSINGAFHHQRDVSDVSTVSGEAENTSARLHRALDAAQYGNAEAGPSKPPVRPFLKTYGTEIPSSSAMSPSTSGPGLRRKRSDRQSEEQKALAKLLKMYEQSVKEVQTLQAKQTEMETNLVIAQSNLVLAENHAEVLEDTIKRNSQARLSGGAFANAATSANGMGGAKRTSGSRSPALGNSSAFATTTDDAEGTPPTVPSPRLGGFWRRAAAAASGGRAPAVAPSGTSSTLSSVVEHENDATGRGSASYDGSSEDEPSGLLRKPSMPMLRSISGTSQSAAREKEAKAQAGVIATLQEKLTTLQSEHTALQLEHSSLRDERDSINQRYTSLQEEIENLSVSLFEEANTMVAEERRVNSFLNEQLDRAKEEVEELHREVDRLKALTEGTSERPVMDRAASESPRVTKRPSFEANTLTRSLQHRQSISSMHSGMSSSTRGSRRRSSVPALEILEHVVSASPRRGSRDVAAVAAAMAALARGEPIPDMPDLPSARRSLSISSANSHRQPLTASSDTSNPLTAISDSSSFAERSTRRPDLNSSKRAAQLTAPIELDESPSKDRVGLALSPEMQPSPPRPRRSSDRARQRSLSRSQSQRLQERMGRSSSSSSASDDAMSDGGLTPLKTSRPSSAAAARPPLVSRSSSSATATSQTRSERSNSNASSTASTASSARRATTSQASRPLRSTSRLTAHLEMSPNPDAELATPVMPPQRSRQLSTSGQTPLASAQDAFNRMSAAVDVTPRPPSSQAEGAAAIPASEPQQPREFDELFAQIQRDVDRMGVSSNSANSVEAAPTLSISSDVGQAISPSSSTISDGRSLRTKAAWNRGIRSPMLSSGSISPHLASPAAFFAAPQPFSSPSNVSEPATGSAALEFEFDLPFSKASPKKGGSTTSPSIDSATSARSPYRPPRTLPMSDRSLSSTTSSSSTRSIPIPSSTLSDPSGSISRPNIPSSITLPSSDATRQIRPPLNSGNSISSTSSASIGLGLHHLPAAGVSHPNTPISPFPLPTPPPFKRFPESNSFREPFYSPHKGANGLPFQAQAQAQSNGPVPPRPTELHRGDSSHSARSTTTSQPSLPSTTTLTRSESTTSITSTTSSLSRYLTNHNPGLSGGGPMDRTNSGFSVNDDLDTLMKSIDAINESLGSPAHTRRGVANAWMR